MVESGTATSGTLSSGKNSSLLGRHQPSSRFQGKVFKTASPVPIHRGLRY